MQHQVNGMFQKNGLIVMYLARKLLDCQPGDKMEKIVDIAAAMNVGRGTVQTAIKNLENSGAISLETRGHLGTFITAIDYPALLHVSGMSHLVGVMPLPYSKRYEGLATGIYNVLNQVSGSPVSLAFMPGAERRIDSLLERRYNFAVVSRESADHYVSQQENLEILFVCSKHTFVKEHAFISRSDFAGIQAGMRVGIDYSSFDQISLTTQLVQNNNIELIPMKYSSIIDNIKTGKIDGAVWSLEDRIIIDTELKYEEISSTTDAKNTKAAILIRDDDEGTRNFLKRFFEKQKVEEIQQLVLDDKMLPNY